jgi:tRNA(Ile)-lysidine synthase
LDSSAEDAALAKLALGARTPDWGGVVLPRELFKDGPPAGLRLLQIAVAVASGRQALGRPERAGAVLERLATGERFVASLGGARLAAGNELLIAREAGEYARGGSTEIQLSAGKPAVWDGRFELTAVSDGLVVRPLRGLAVQLEEAEKKRLYQIPAAARGALPAVVEPSGRVSGPILAASVPGRGQTRLRGLTAERFAAACGLIEREGAACGIACMAN